jgi:hypothetical protein
LVRYLSYPGSIFFSTITCLADAGGPGALSGQFIVEEIMRRLAVDSKMDQNKPPLPCDHADLMIGTQLGACVYQFDQFDLDLLTPSFTVSQRCSWVDYAYLQTK